MDPMALWAKQVSTRWPTINILANAALGPGISGGDRIFIECARRWAEADRRVTIFVWEEGYDMCRRNDLQNVDYTLWPIGRFGRAGFVLAYVARVLQGLIRSVSRKLATNEKVVIYSASDFWPDVWPAFVAKSKSKTVKWVAGLYLLAPAPWAYGGLRAAMKGVLYYLSQRVSVSLMRRKADLVLVLNPFDRATLLKRGFSPGKVTVISGGIDINNINKVPMGEKTFDACFIGRLHAQKGIHDLFMIWKDVCQTIKKARLAIIGSGTRQWERFIEEKMIAEGLQDNVYFLGFLDGEPKFRVLKTSKVFLITSSHESFAMVVCEAMACALPVVAYDLPIFEKLFPQGMIRVPIGQTHAFANTVVQLLTDENRCEMLGRAARETASRYDWDVVAKDILQHFDRICAEDLSFHT